MEPPLTVWNRFVLLALRIAGVHVGEEVVRNGRHAVRHDNRAVPEGAAFSEQAADLARELYKQETDRTRSFEDKGRTLLTVNGLLISVLVALGRFGPLPVLGLVASATPLLLSLLVLLEIHGPRVTAFPAVDNELLSTADEAQRALIARSYITARLFLAGSNDYLLDLLEAARKLVAFGLLVSIVVGLLGLMC